MALLWRGHLSIIELCFEVGCTSLGSYGSAFTWLVGRHAARTRARHVNDGLVVRRQGQGTFVAEPKLVQSDHIRSFSEDMRARGKEPGARLISIGVEDADPLVVARLGLSPGAQVVHVVRVRTGDGEPIALERANLPADRFPGLAEEDLTKVSLYELIERRWNVRLHRAEQRISAVLPDPEDARLLETSPALPAFLIERVTRDVDDGVIEYGRSLYRGNRYEVLMNVYRRRENGA